MKKILSFLVLIPLWGIGQGVHCGNGLNWQQILEKAKAEDKYIFVDCYASWYGPCKRMDRVCYIMGIYFLQESAIDPEILNKLPSFDALIKGFGPFLAMILILVIAICIAQYIWYRKRLMDKDKEN